MAGITITSVAKSYGGKTEGAAVSGLDLEIRDNTFVTENFVLISPQHPGDLDDASPDAPKSVWPDGPGTQPRPSVVNIWRTGRAGQPGRIGA